MENDLKLKMLDEICCELDCLLTNGCDFIFTDDATYEAIEKEKITSIIYEYRDRIRKNIDKEFK